MPIVRQATFDDIRLTWLARVFNRLQTFKHSLWTSGLPRSVPIKLLRQVEGKRRLFSVSWSCWTAICPHSRLFDQVILPKNIKLARHRIKNRVLKAPSHSPLCTVAVSARSGLKWCVPARSWGYEIGFYGGRSASSGMADRVTIQIRAQKVQPPSLMPQEG